MVIYTSFLPQEIILTLAKHSPLLGDLWKKQDLRLLPAILLMLEEDYTWKVIHPLFHQTYHSSIFSIIITTLEQKIIELPLLVILLKRQFLEMEHLLSPNLCARPVTNQQLTI